MELLFLEDGTDRLNGLAPAWVERACARTRRGLDNPRPPDCSRRASQF